MNTSTESILEAIDSIDVDNDANWTTAGLPSVEAVNLYLKEHGLEEVKRSDITAAAPEITRETILTKSPDSSLEDLIGDVGEPDKEDLSKIPDPAEPAEGGEVFEKSELVDEIAACTRQLQELELKKDKITQAEQKIRKTISKLSKKLPQNNDDVFSQLHAIKTRQIKE